MSLAVYSMSLYYCHTLIYINLRSYSYTHAEVRSAFGFSFHTGSRAMNRKMELVNRSARRFSGGRGVRRISLENSPKKGAPDSYETPITTVASWNRGGIVQLDPQYLFPDHPPQIKVDAIDLG